MTQQRVLVSSGSLMEPRIGFSRAVRVGNHVVVAGTAAIGDDGRNVGVGDVVAQAQRCLEIVAAALNGAGATMQDVVRTRVLLTDRADWTAVADVHGAWFSAVRPACTVAIVSGFIDPEWLVEFEVDAIIPTEVASSGV